MPGKGPEAMPGIKEPCFEREGHEVLEAFRELTVGEVLKATAKTLLRPRKYISRSEPAQATSRRPIRVPASTVVP
jgi:hypothetical protein